MTGNLQADGVQSRQTLFVRYCLRSGSGNRVREITGCLRGLLVQPEKITRVNPSASFAVFPALIRRFSCRRKCRSGCRRGQAFRSWGRCVPVQPAGAFPVQALRLPAGLSFRDHSGYRNGFPPEPDCRSWGKAVPALLPVQPPEQEPLFPEP